jgi:hypothetical protein
MNRGKKQIVIIRNGHTSHKHWCKNKE